MATPRSLQVQHFSPERVAEVVLERLHAIELELQGGGKTDGGATAHREQWLVEGL